MQLPVLALTLLFTTTLASDVAKLIAVPVEAVPTSTLVDPGSATPIVDPDTEVIFIEPPPIFDPPEPRPDTLFDPSGLSPEAALRPPPIAEHRTEHTSPFDGAHVHPNDTPYKPEMVAETGCREVLKLGLAGMSMMVAVMGVFFVVGKVCRGLFRLVRRRAGRPSGQILLEETTVEMDVEKGAVVMYGPNREVIARSRSGSKVVIHS